MKLVTLDFGTHTHCGVLLNDELVLDLVRLAHVLPAARLIPSSVKGVLEAGSEGLDLVRRVVDGVQSGKSVSMDQLLGQGVAISIERAEFSASVLGAMVMSCGGAQRSHNKEMGEATPKDPSSFLKNNASLVGTGQAIVLPSIAPDMVDWEGEFCGVIGRPCHRVSPEEALDYVAGYTLINDVSARDWVKPFFQSSGHPMAVARAFLVNVMGKQFPTFCPLGPCIATKDELPDPSNVVLTTKVNGEIMQQANTSELEFSLAELISYFSRFYRFMPGDVISTGTPSGVGFGRDPQVFLKEGDVVEVSVDEIGTLRNSVIRES
ncbi:fumarylacetoacetate hydrolase family protein [Pusillimonas sp.]|uniref:fumarylacetoacetate hydrolase family protein n=1 Tax=Pusillimonas sp. TaxID=3040095 RepID=UPI0029A5F09F|nr:fumarylacetoacetate hydrolase family protein [Pusillimonas sp.]MDX3895547.1 fumarylacetoacetate hydrolase family protein [Pusillimonas sp.]